MLFSFVGPPFAVLVELYLVVAFLSFTWFALWNGIEELKGDCPVNVPYAAERLPVECKWMECGSLTDQVD